jgi:hypothetical protein
MVEIPLWFRLFVRKFEYLFVETKNELCCWRVSKCHVTSTTLFYACRDDNMAEVSFLRKLGPRPRAVEGPSLLVPRRLSLFSFYSTDCVCNISVYPLHKFRWINSTKTEGPRYQEGHDVCQFLSCTHKGKPREFPSLILFSCRRHARVLCMFF